MQTNKKLEGDIIGLEKYKHVSDPIIHKSDLNRAFKEQLKDVVRKSDLDRILKEELKDVVRKKDLDIALTEIKESIVMMNKKIDKLAQIVQENLVH